MHSEFKRGRGSFGCESKRNLSTRYPLPLERESSIYASDRTQLRLAAAAGSYETNYETVLISSMFRIVNVKLLTSSTTCDRLLMHTTRIRTDNGDGMCYSMFRMKRNRYSFNEVNIAGRNLLWNKGGKKLSLIINKFYIK